MKLLQEEESLCVFVANLPAFLNNNELSERVKNVLDPFGKVKSVKTSRDIKNRPFAFVQFEGPVYDFMLTEMVMIEDRILRFEKAKSSFNPDKVSNYGNVNEQEGFVPPGLGTGGGVYYPIPCAPAEYVIPYYPEFDPSLSLAYQVHPQAIPVYPITPYPTTYSPESDSSTQGPEEGTNKIFVSHLNGELVTQRKLLRHFQHYGHITDIELFKNNLDGSLRLEAFAFISYLKPEQMLEAIRAENGREWLGKRLKCCRALKKREKPVESKETETVESAENVESTESSESTESAAVPVEPVETEIVCNASG